MNKLDLNKIKEEIKNAKLNNPVAQSRLVEGSGKPPRDEFLNGLITSLNSGVNTPAISLIKEVENKVSEKLGETIKPQQSQSQQRKVQSTVDMSPERDEQLFADLEKKRNQTLAEGLERFGAPSQTPINNYNGNQYLNSVPNQNNYNGNQYLNSVPNQNNYNGSLNENVKELVNTHLANNLSPIFEEAIKGTIIEMYAVEQIKKVLNENRELIRSVVVETIRDIQAKNRAKK